MTTDFRSLMSKPLDEVKRPEALPAGTYLGRIVNYEFGESKEKKTPYVRFNLGVDAAGENVDPASVAEVDFSKKKFRRDYFLTDDAYYRLKELMESLGITTAGRTMDECLPETQNMPVLIELVQSINQRDPMAPPYNEVTGIAAQK